MDKNGVVYISDHGQTQVLGHFENGKFVEGENTLSYRVDHLHTKGASHIEQSGTRGSFSETPNGNQTAEEAISGSSSAENIPGASGIEDTITPSTGSGLENSVGTNGNESYISIDTNIPQSPAEVALTPFELDEAVSIGEHHFMDELDYFFAKYNFFGQLIKHGAERTAWLEIKNNSAEDFLDMASPLVGKEYTQFHEDLIDMSRSLDMHPGKNTTIEEFLKDTMREQSIQETKMHIFKQYYPPVE